MANHARKIVVVCSLAVMVSMAIGCGADLGVDLDNLTSSESSAVSNQFNPNHVPVCQAEDSRGEGWYWADTNELIKYENCNRDAEPECAAIGSRSEGWFSENGLITWDACHGKVRISLYGEACGGSIGFVCFEDQNLYCQGMPTNGLIGGTGTCQQIGFCETADDCLLEGNNWERPDCAGYATCEENTCNWVCDDDVEPEEEPNVWSWTTTLANEVESAHPYESNVDRTWTITRDGAAKIKLNLTLDTEYGFDWVVVWSDGEQPAQWLTGNLENVWTNEFEGNTLHVSLYSDHSNENWGVKVEAVSYYEQIPRGMCNVSEDCSEGTSCNPSQCINPFAPCYGECR